MCKYVLGLSRELVIERKMTLLIENFHISILIMYIQQVEDEKNKKVKLSEK